MNKVSKQWITLQVHITPYSVGIKFQTSCQRVEALSVLQDMVKKAEEKYGNPTDELNDVRAYIEIAMPAQDAINAMAGYSVDKEAHSDVSYANL